MDPHEHLVIQIKDNRLKLLTEDISEIRKVSN